MSHLTLRGTLARVDTVGIDLGGPFRREIVLAVDRALRTQGGRALRSRFLVVSGADDGQRAVGLLLQTERQFIQRIAAIVVYTPRFMWVLFEGALAPVLDVGTGRRGWGWGCGYIHGGCARAG